MQYLWQRQDWTSFSYDREVVRPLVEEICSLLDEIRGSHFALDASAQRSVFIDELREEITASYAIEGERLDPDYLTQSLTRSLAQQGLDQLQTGYKNISAMMLDLYDDAQAEMSTARLHHWHQLLFETSGLTQVGAYRQSEMQIVSGHFGHEVIEYEAPLPKEIPSLMQDFIRYANDSDDHYLIRAALAHVYFETIHPYEDGNGRIGRALTEALILKHARVENLPLNLSRELLQQRKTYYAQLKQMQVIEPGEDPDCTAYLRWFLTVIQTSIESLRQQIRFIIRRDRFWNTHRDSLNERQRKVLEHLFHQGVARLELPLSRKPYMKMAGISASATATRDLTDLYQRGLLKKTEQGGRSQSYLVVY